MRSDAAVALKKSNVFWISSSTFSVIACSTGCTSSNVDAVDRLALLQALGALERQVQLFLHRLGVGVAADRDVAREDRLIAAEDVDVDRARAGVEQHDDRLRLEAVVDLVRVLQRERVDIHDDRLRPACAMTPV